MNKNEIKAQLRKLPIEASIALAIRGGLRILPWLALFDHKEYSKNNSSKIFAFNLMAIWQAYDVGLLGIFNRHQIGLRLVARKRRDNADTSAYAFLGIAQAHYIRSIDAVAYEYARCAAVAAAAAAAYAAVTASAAADADFDVDADITFTVASAAAASVVAAVSAAADADSAAATANPDAVAQGVLAKLKFNIENDLMVLRDSSAKELIESPLWITAAPPSWVKQLELFRTRVRALDDGFEFWLNWYDARCRGGDVDMNFLKQRVFVPESIASQPAKEVNAYLASLTQGLAGAPLNRVRTIFIGDGEAGKTSLIRVLHGESVVEGIEAKTPGIEIREWRIPQTAITASFWDFGGQVMVHATHQLFLRESCLYVLLVSAREKEKATERAEYWMEHVKSFGKSSPVLIVANKADKEAVRLDEGLLMEKYPGMIGGFFQLSCTDTSSQFRSRFDEFRSALCQQLQAVGLHQVQFMKPHFAVLQNLRDRTPSQAFLTHADYNALCDVQNVDAHGALDRYWLLDILDKLGVIVHFPDMIEMDEYILNPRWLTYGVYTLMYNEQARITRAQAVALLASKPIKDQYGNQLSYPASKCRIVFEAMRKYKLCYFLPSDPNQIIIPALLPSDIKQHGFDISSALEFQYQFESFLPRHLISELIVECHQDIANKDGQDVVWQHGVMLDNATHQTQALIQADYHLRRLSIWLSRGSRMADMLAALRDRIEKIVSRIDIEYEQKVRLPGDALLTPPRPGAKPAFANFLQLREMLADGQDRYVHEFGGKYSISKILGLFEPKGGVSGNTNINISASTIIGNVTAASEIANSLNEEN